MRYFRPEEKERDRAFQFPLYLRGDIKSEVSHLSLEIMFSACKVQFKEHRR